MKTIYNKLDKEDVKNLPIVSFPGKIFTVNSKCEADKAVPFLLYKYIKYIKPIKVAILVAKFAPAAITAVVSLFPIKKHINSTIATVHIVFVNCSIV